MCDFVSFKLIAIVSNGSNVGYYADVDEFSEEVSLKSNERELPDRGCEQIWDNFFNLMVGLGQDVMHIWHMVRYS